jgi:uncharacterized membrane protein
MPSSNHGAESPEQKTESGHSAGSPSDETVESIIGNLLRAGVLLSAAVTLAGGLWYLFQHGAQPVADYRHFQAQPGQLGGMTGIVGLVTAQQSRGLILIGIVLLIATPVARVVLALVAFALQHDWFYVGVSLIVLAVLLYSIATGFL